MATTNQSLTIDDELYYWGSRVFKRIKDNFTLMQINKQKRKGGFTGNLYRDIFWQVHKMAAGNQQRIDFFYEYYGKFVEMGVSKGFAYVRAPKMMHIGAVKIPGRKRPSKPFLSREIRYHAEWLQDRLSYVYHNKTNLAILYGIQAGIEQEGGKSSDAKIED